MNRTVADIHRNAETSHQAIVDDVAEMHSLLAMPEKRVLQVMEGLQLVSHVVPLLFYPTPVQELHDPHLSRATRDSFSLALWTLHEQMIIMPPLIDRKCRTYVIH
jgi:hypothetical protein